jgi:hypothetical protein
MRDEYEKARKALAISAEDLALLAPHRHAEITLAIIERFTSLGRSGLSARWWWESFVDEAWAVTPGSPFDFVGGFLEPQQRYWFVAEAWSEKKDSAFWVYDATGAAIRRILPECHHHEYYIIDRKMTWLLCENHHGVVMACGALKKPEPNQSLEPTAPSGRGSS